MSVVNNYELVEHLDSFIIPSRRSSIARLFIGTVIKAIPEIKFEIRRIIFPPKKV